MNMKITTSFIISVISLSAGVTCTFELEFAIVIRKVSSIKILILIVTNFLMIDKYYVHACNQEDGTFSSLTFSFH